jgi:lipoate-protein ligase A
MPVQGSGIVSLHAIVRYGPTALHQALNPEPMVDDETLSSVYAVPSVRSEVTNIRRHLSVGTVTDFKEKGFSVFQ